MRNSRFLSLGADNFVVARVRGDGREETRTFTSVRRWDRGVWSASIEYPLGVASLFACDLFGAAHVALFETGEIDLRGDGSTSRIVNAVRPTADHRRGYLLNGRQIGRTLIVTGNGGQTYSSSDGESWGPFIADRFNPPRRETPDFLNDSIENILGILDKDEDVGFQSLTGSPSDLYVCGGDGNLERKIVHWDGVESRSVLPPRTSQTGRSSLSDITIDDSGSVWTCGLRGALMRGNAEEGFVQVAGTDDGLDAELPYYRLALWRNSVWLAGGRGLYRYRDGVLSEVPLPDPSFSNGLHTVEASENGVWVCSLNAIARFDGISWNVIPHPED